MLVSILIGALASLALTTGTQADRSSTSDRNREVALGVAEAGLHEVTARISAQAGGTNTSSPSFFALSPGVTAPCEIAGPTPPEQCDAAKSSSAYRGTTPQGTYWYWVTRTTDGFIIDAQAKTPGTSLSRGRHIRVTLRPPDAFPNANYALFSHTNIALQNNDQVLDGDVFANYSVHIDNSNKDPTVRGSITSATSWVSLDANVHVTGNVWSGGYDQTSAIDRWAIDLGSGALLDGWAKASVSVPNCQGELQTNYNVRMANGSRIKDSVTTFGAKTGGGTVDGNRVTSGACTSAATPQPIPTFTFNKANYGCALSGESWTCPSDYHEFFSVTEFQSWLNANKNDFRGTFRVSDPNPSQTNRVDLTGAKLTGSVTIVTEAPACPPCGVPVYTADLDDANAPGSPLFVLVSHYRPPVSTTCDTEHDSSECAVHVKNNFALNADGTCKTATLVYADKGPVAIKNNGTTCGSVIADGIFVKNGLTIAYDDRISRLVGFSPAAGATYVAEEWQELPAR